MQLTEEWIRSNAPDPEVAENARALSRGGCYSGRMCTGDGMTFWAECAGSAANPYYVSADWSLEGEEPVFSCSCAERQTPCKHVLGLLYELLEDKPFTVGSAPMYVVKVRAREAAERGKARSRLERARKHDAAMREKRLERQLEGVGKAEKLVDAMLADGLGRNLTKVPAQQVDRLAVELGNNDLVGTRDALEHVSLMERRVRLNGADGGTCRAELLRTLAAQHAMLREARAYLDGQLNAGRYAMEEPVLYELLGGEWNPDELLELGSCRRNARLVQLSFDVAYDDPRRAYIERGYWFELGRGDVVCTRNVHSAKVTEAGASDDSCFAVVEAPVLYETPDSALRRVWWDESTERDVTAEDRAAILAAAETSIFEVVRAAAERICQPLLPGYVPALLRVGRVGRVNGTLVLEDGFGERIVLCDRREDGYARASTVRLSVLSQPPAAGEAIFGLVFYDAAERRYCLHPYSLVRADDVVRLQY